MIHHKITPAGVMCIAAALRADPTFTDGFSLEAHMQALIGLREAERIYHERCRAGRLTWKGAAQLRKLREPLGDPVLPSAFLSDVVDLAALRARIDAILATAPKNPKDGGAKSPLTPLVLLVGQDLPLAYLALTGTRAKRARIPDTSEVYKKGFVVFAWAALAEMELAPLSPKTIVRYLELIRQKRIF
jgi:hypothetical protein